MREAKQPYIRAQGRKHLMNTPVAFLDEGATTPRQMNVSEALALAVARAAHANTNKEAFSISSLRFSSAYSRRRTRPANGYARVQQIGGGYTLLA
jgi:hypothetical protein